MELKKYIESTTKLIEYKDKELDFAYGLEEYHTSFRRMFKQIIRIIFR